MSDTPDTKYVVNPSALPDLGTVAVRYAAVLLSGWLVRKGYITGNDEPLIIGLALAIAAIGWAGWKSYTSRVRLVTIARAAPDTVATVTEPTPPPSAA